MADNNAAELLKRGDKRFGDRSRLDAFRQEVALNFCPWHASFTTAIGWGDDFASHLVDGTPLLLARDFEAQIGSMLRPPGKQWFWDRTDDEELNNEREIRTYLDWRSRQKMRVIFDRATGAARALKQADGFFAMFGDAVLSVDLNAARTQLRVKNYHVKDVVWALGDEGKANVITRKEQISARNYLSRFKQPGDKVPPEIKRKCDQDPDTLIDIRHEIMPSTEYDAYNPFAKHRTGGEPYVSVWVDETHKSIIRETPQSTMRYVVASWVRLPHMPYAISPATTIAIPDARLIQQQALAILDAAEKGANPPLVATYEAIRGQVDARANGITWIERNYDERMGEPLRPLDTGKNAGIGVDALMYTKQQLTSAFYLDILRLPDTRNTKSTLETQFRIDEYVRAALPLFAPMQSDYSEAFLQEVDAVLATTDFEDRAERPEALQDQRLVYQWDNPLAEMIERQKVQVIAEVSSIGQTMAALEAAASQVPALQQLDTPRVFREAVVSIGGAKMLLSERQVKQNMDAASAAAEQQATMAQATQLAPLIDSGVNAAKASSEIPIASEPGFPLLPEPE